MTTTIDRARLADLLSQETPIPTDPAEAYDRRRALTAAGLDEDVAVLVAQAERDFARHSDEILHYAANVERDLARAREYVEKGLHVNARGEIQSNAVNLDRACALREAAAERVHECRYFAARYACAEPDDVDPR